MNYHRTLCALALSAAVAAGWNEAEARTPQGPDTKGRKLGHCYLQKNIAAPQLNATGNATTLRAPEGKVVSRVSLKAGSNCIFTPDGASGTWTHNENGAACYKVEGLGTPAAVVTRVGNGRGCVGIAQLQFLSAAAAPSGENGGGNSGGGNTGGGDTGGGAGDPLLGAIVVCSNASSAPAGMTFGISISTRFQEIALFDVPAGGCTPALQVEEGWYIVSQGLPEGFTVADITSDPSGHIVSADPLGGQATALVLTGSRTTLSFANAAQ